MGNRHLRISENLDLPLDAATQTFAFIARKGAGKTYAAGKLAECLMDAGVQVVILDSVGNWWGLRLSADGKTPAYDIPVIGGLRGDIPLEATGGHLIADIVIDTGRSLIVDVSQFSKAHRQKFAYEFAERLWRAKKAERHPVPLHLVIEESQLIVPQFTGKGNTDGTALMVGIYEEIIRLGRNYGIGVTMISQRPQSVNKEVLNQTECLFALQVNGAQERKALELWITHQGLEKDLVDELPSLPIGTAYVWSPQWLGILQKVKIGQKKTFDASATPKVGSHQVRRELKPLNLDDLQERMAATIEKAKATDPKELNKTINDLRAQVRKFESAKLSPTASKEQISAVVSREVAKATKTLTIALGDAMKFIVKINAQSFTGEGIDEDTVKAAVGAAMGEVKKSITAKLKTRDAEIEKLRKEGASILRRLKALNGNQNIEIDVTVQHNQPFTVAPTPRTSTARAPREPVEFNGDISGPMQKILNELAELEAVGILPADKAQLGLFCGYTNVKSGGFTGPLGKLREMELIHYPGSGEVALTDDGRAKAAETGDPLTTSDLQNRILNKLDGPRAKVLRQLIKLYPDSIDKETLGGQLGYTNVKSGGFTGPLGSLRKLGLIEYPHSGTVAASALLFPPGLN